jgi:hypothetical protein
MKPEVKVFSREAPCTKLEIWNCFRAAKGFVRIPAIIAQSHIGANVPRVMEKEGRLITTEQNGIEYYVLTVTGQEWLYEGLRRYLKNHPAHAAQVNHLPASWGYQTGTARLRRTR